MLKDCLYTLSIVLVGNLKKMRVRNLFYSVILSIRVCLILGPLDGMLRVLALGQYGHYGNKKTVEEAQRRFVDHTNKKEQIPANLRGVVFGLCMANGDDTTFDQLIKVWADSI